MVVLSAYFVSEALVSSKCSSECKLSNVMLDVRWRPARFEKNWRKDFYVDHNFSKNDSW